MEIVSNESLDLAINFLTTHSKESKTFLDRMQELRSVSSAPEVYTEKIVKVYNYLQDGRYMLMRLTVRNTGGPRIDPDLAERITCPDKQEALGIIHAEDKFAYNTTRWGEAYDFTWWIIVENTHITDKSGMEIYKSITGVPFVVDAWPGSPAAFGGRILKNPNV